MAGRSPHRGACRGPSVPSAGARAVTEPFLRGDCEAAISKQLSVGPVAFPVLYGKQVRSWGCVHPVAADRRTLQQASC